MTDANTVAEREYSRKVAERGDYSYLELKSEAEAMIREMLYNGELTDIVDAVSKDLPDFTEWMKLIGGAIAKDKFFIQQFSNIYISKFSDTLIERIEKERGL